MTLSHFKTKLAGALAALLILGAPLQAQDGAEMLLRLDRLEQLVRQLNGQLEQAQNQNRRLEEQVRRFQSDTDFRFKELEGARGGPRPAGTPPAAPPRQQRGDAFDPATNPAVPGAPQPLGSPNSATPPRPQRQAGAGVVSDPGRIIEGEENAIGRDPRQPADLTPRAPTASQPAAPANPPATPRGQIELGRQQLANGEYEAAEGTFREFARSRPTDRLSSEAAMGLGDSFFQRQRWREAAEHYVDVTTKYARSARAPEAELKLGISLRGLGATKEACDVLVNHAQKHPTASPAIKQGVAREMQRARCSG